MSDNEQNNPSELNAGNHSELFASLVLQQSNMALLLMGKSKPPGQEEPIKDLESARFFVDLLEMIEAKTKGNLTREESKLLGQTLMGLRLAYVEAADEDSRTGGKASSEPKAERAPAQTPVPQAQQESAPASAPAAEESHKKFTKKY